MGFFSHSAARQAAAGCSGPRRGLWYPVNRTDVEAEKYPVPLLPTFLDVLGALVDEGGFRAQGVLGLLEVIARMVVWYWSARPGLVNSLVARAAAALPVGAGMWAMWARAAPLGEMGRWPWRKSTWGMAPETAARPGVRTFSGGLLLPEPLMAVVFQGEGSVCLE